MKPGTETKQSDGIILKIQKSHKSVKRKLNGYKEWQRNAIRETRKRLYEN
jgi:hypothetical protein